MRELRAGLGPKLVRPRTEPVDLRKLLVGGLGAGGGALRLLGSGLRFFKEPLHLGGRDKLPGRDLRLDGLPDFFGGGGSRKLVQGGGFIFATVAILPA